MHEIIKLVAEYFLVFSVIGAALVYYRISHENKVRFALLIVVGGVITLLLAKIGSLLFYDPRPFVQGHFVPILKHAVDNGFPSDHTLLAAFLAWASLVYSRKLGSILLIVAVLVGLARMAAGVHHSLDILGSFVFAAIGCFGAHFLLNLFYKPVMKSTKG